MQNKKNNKKREKLRDISFEELLMDEDGAFDDEDADTVTDDTLEFLSLDDEMIETYNRSHKASKGKATAARELDEEYEDEEDDEYGDEEDDEYGDEEDDEYEDDEYGDEEDDEYEDEEYEDEEDDEYEDEEYEDEEDDEYEDEEYDDDEYEYDAYAEDSAFVRFKEFLGNMSTLDVVVAMLGIVVLVGVFVTGSLYVNARMTEKQVEAFASVGDEIKGVSVIGEGGLIAVSESAKLTHMVEAEEEEQEQEEEKEEKKETIEVSLRLTSIQSDLKIKFVNQETGKLIGSVPFEVEVAGGKKTYNLKDEDKDGIIYQTGIESGSYKVTIKPFTGTDYQEYKLPSQASAVEVTDKIAYKKVDVADEVKTEAEVNAAAEDTAQQNTVVESVLTDTVEWVESTKTPIEDGEESYEKVPESDIPNPWTVSSAYRKLVEEGLEEEQPETRPEDVTVSLDKSSVTLKKGESTSVKVSVSDSSARYVVEWSSADSSIATVSDGSVTGVGVGSTSITARVAVGSIVTDLSCSVTVEEAQKDDDKEEEKDEDEDADKDDDDKKDEDKEVVYTKVSIDGSKEVAVGKTITLKASTEPKDGKVSWSSENEKIAKVDKNGVVTGVAEGTVKIKAVCKNEETDDVSASYEITVKKEATADGSTKLKDKDGNQLYYRNSNKEYIEATYDDYGKKETFYKKTTKVSKYKYTGWQTIDGHVYYYDKNGNVVTGEQVIQGAKYNFGSDGKLSSNSGSMGIDVSKWNGSIDWNAVKNSGVSYVIIRCGYRGSSTGVLVEDPKFKSNIKGAKAAGLKVGAYFFSQATNEVEAVEEASMAVNLVSGYGLNYPIFLDVEASGGRGDNISKETRTAVCKAFCATVQNSGYSAGIYANKTWLTEKINTGSLTSYKIWLAQYASAPTYKATRYDMWQYSSKGKVSGISGSVDMNISYLNY